MIINGRRSGPYERVRRMKSLAFSSGVLLVLLASGCSSSATPASTGTAPSGQSGEDAGTSTSEVPASTDAGQDPHAAKPGTCRPISTPSQCKNDGAWVRGVVHFDGSRFKDGSVKPVLRVTLRHQFTLVKGEENVGGRLHAYKTFPITNPAAGRYEFSLDMCQFGTAMWSEENGAFNLIAHLDENDNNDLDTAKTNDQAVKVATPDTDELVKMVTVDVSCNAASPCLDMTLDCTGAECLKIEPMASCKKKTPGCKSDDSFCN